MTTSEVVDWDRGKSTAGYRIRGRSLEPIAAPDPTIRTPIDSFFVCNAGHAAEIRKDDWSLQVHGDVETETELSFDRLADLPQHHLTSWLECAGNGRQLFLESAGIDLGPQATPWLLNGMGLAQWCGPRLRDVLAIAGVLDSANWVSPMGLDEPEVEEQPPRMCLPIDKAMHEDTIVALTMNGAPLPRAHGAPARLLVPGWIGAYSIKWLGDLTIAAEWVPSWRADEYYVHRLPDGTNTGPITAHPVKSNLSLDFPAMVSAGAQRLCGVARSGDAEVVGVQWRLNGGSWNEANIDVVDGRWAWTPFSFSVDLPAGEHVIETCATDAAGNTQPPHQPAHPDGVLWCAITPHPITVSPVAT